MACGFRERLTSWRMRMGSTGTSPRMRSLTSERYAILILRDCKELIEEVFKKTVTIAKALGIPELGHLSTDGTKMKANASNNYTLSEEEIEEIAPTMTS